jgi:hypothetical protein
MVMAMVMMEELTQVVLPRRKVSIVEESQARLESNHP